MMTVLAGLAEFERELIRARTSAGRDSAKAKGVRFGRKPKLSAHQRAHALELLDGGRSQAEVGRIFGVDQATDEAYTKLFDAIHRLSAELSKTDSSESSSKMDSVRSGHKELERP
jgi:hypothetical protein